MTVPVLYLIYNRPDLVEVSFESIKEAKPKYLFVAADGPKSTSDQLKCQECRDYVLNNIDWDCDVKTLFRERNLGCGLAVSQSVTWFFEYVDKGIILEDDIVPHQDFYRLCKLLLEKYENDVSVWMISGFSVLGEVHSPDSYAFSKYSLVWGWATWKRSWSLYDYTLNQTKKKDFKRELLKFKASDNEINFWLEKFDQIKQGLIDTWDYQLQISQFLNNGISIIPYRSLIENIGFRDDATHTKDIPQRLLNHNFGNQLEGIVNHPLKVGVNNTDLLVGQDLFNSFKTGKNYTKIGMRENLIIIIKKLYHLSISDLVNKLIKSKNTVSKKLSQWESIRTGIGRGLQLYIDEKSFSGWSEMLNGTYDLKIFQHLEGKIGVANCIYDIGAHFGYNSLILSKMYDRSDIYCFEPNAANVSVLEMNIERNKLEDRLKVIAGAISDFNGDSTFIQSDDVAGSRSTGSHLKETLTPLSKQHYEGFSEVKVPVFTLDLLIAKEEISSADLIKIDVEGAEYNVLLGASQLIKQHHPKLIIEIHSVIAMFDCIQWLKDNDYKCEIIDESESSSRCYIYCE